MFTCSEMWHGKRWRTDPKYQTPMVETPHVQAFVGDFVRVNDMQDSYIGTFIAKLTRFYMKVMWCGYVHVCFKRPVVNFITFTITIFL